MADLSVTVTQVVPDTSGEIRTGPAAAIIEAGEAVYFNESNQNWALADASALATLNSGTKIGIAVSTANVAAQKLSVQVTGSPTIGAGASVAAGQTYVVSETAGGIAEESDTGAAAFTCILGIGNGSDGIDMNAAGVLTASTAHA